jgi:kynurenine formamidase
MIDLSHPVEHGLITYQGLPAPVISRHNWPDSQFHIGRIEMVANTGTYVDSPFHRYPNGLDLAGLPLESLADLPGVVVTPDRIDGDFTGKAVLVHTGWDRHWRTERYWSGDHPFLTGAQAQKLLTAAFVGIDSYNIDDIRDPARPVHTTLLGAGIPICEHMTNLGALPASGFRFFAVPVKVRGLGSFPVRAFAITP